MLRVGSLVAVLACCGVVGCGSDGETGAAQNGAAGASSGTGGAAGGSAGSGNAGSHNVASGDASADDGGPYVLPDLDTACDGGPTGKQLLGFIHAPYAGTFSPPTKRAAMYPWNGPTTTSALTVGVEYKDGAILCAIDHYVCPGGGVPCRVKFPPTVTMDLNVTFKTADGVLNEAFAATARYEPNITNVSFRGELPADKVGGTYPIATGTKDQVKLVFMGQFESNQYNGTISEVGQGVSIPGGSWAETAVGAGVDAASDH